MKIKEGKTSLRVVNCGLKMHEQQVPERAAMTHEQQPHERAAARRSLDRRSGSASRSSSLRQPSSSSDFQQPQQF
ncbi:hypothetical protein WN943_021778 [Citrus x changshan-huyou]